MTSYQPSATTGTMLCPGRRPPQLPVWTVSHPALSGFGHTWSVSTILVVDDEPAVRDALERALKAQHYTVATAIDGRQALDTIAERHPELVLLDVLMPVMDGFEACRRLRQLGDRTPV